jgi:hypothetical protein
VKPSGKIATDIFIDKSTLLWNNFIIQFTKEDIMKIILIVKLLIIALMLSLLNAAWANPVDEHTMCLLNFDKDSLVIESGKLTKVKDFSGNGNDGLVNTQGGKKAGNPGVQPSGPPESVEGKFGEALYFDGTNYLEVVDSKTIGISDQLTMEAWVKPEVLVVSGDAMSVTTKDVCYYMQVRDGKIGNYFYNVNPPGYHESKKDIKVGVWTHIAVTYDGKEKVFYINGEEDSRVSATGKIQMTNDSLGIAAEVRVPSRGEANQRYYKGIIDEVRVSDIARTPAEIKESFQNGLLMAVDFSGKLAITWGQIKREK